MRASALAVAVAACGASTHPAPAPASSVAASAPVAAGAPARIQYPPARRADTVDDYHGTRVADPYRWLEDPDSPETRAWVEAENKLTFGILEKSPWRARFRDRLEKLWNHERFGIPWKKGGRYFYTHNTGLQNQDVLYTMERRDAEPRVLLDPNTLSPDGTIAMPTWSPTEDGKLVAYALSEAGSDWEEWHVRRVDTGADLPDLIKWSKFSGAAWTKDNRGFFYQAYDPPPAGAERTATSYFQKVYYHRLGTPQAKDELVYSSPDHKEWIFDTSVTDDGRFLILQTYQSSDDKSLVSIRDLGKKGGKLVPVVTKFEAIYRPAGNVGSRLTFYTNKDAPRGRMAIVDLGGKAPAWKPLVPEETATLTFGHLVGHTLVGVYLEDARARVTLFSPAGQKQKDLQLPGIGSVGGFIGEVGDTETFFSFESYAVPATIYRYDFAKGASEVFRAPKVDFDPSAFETGEVFAKSKDGTRVPLFLAHKKGIALDGNNPTFLFGYGGFDINETPGFAVSRLVWMEQGGVFADAVLRGGGEYGEAWHEAAKRERKQNVFDDFIACAEFLVADKITRPARLAINGGSNGGLLVGAVLNQRPDLFGAAVPQVGVMDMLRFHKYTIGWLWAEEYGSSDDPEQWKSLYAYSPLHNVKPGTKYPPTLITTADHDDRVVPAHSFKYAAALQAAQGGDAPVLIRIETRAGHGPGKPVSKKIEEAADILAFMAEAVGMQPL